MEALEKVQPKDLTASEIFVQLGTTWLPEEIAQQFMYEFLDTPRYAQWNIKVHYSKLTGEWNVEGKSYDRSNLKAYNTYGTKRVNAYKIIEDTLNMKDVRVFDYMEDDEGKKKAVLNKRKPLLPSRSRSLSSRAFRIGYGVIPQDGKSWYGCITTNSTVSAPVSMMGAISF